MLLRPTTTKSKAAIICARAHAFQIRVLSRGHDFEGLSYRSRHRLVLIDLVNLRSITINMDDETAWVQAGATLGELYHNIANKSDSHAFPAGLCPSVGVGGHISGGGIRPSGRKNHECERRDPRQGIDGRGSFLGHQRRGGASFGIILAWRVQLVRVPPLATVSPCTKT